MPDINKLTLCKPQPLGDWKPEDTLIDILIKIGSNRYWDHYTKVDYSTKVVFTYREDHAELEEGLKEFEL